jgi:hypothetical protein
MQSTARLARDRRFLDINQHATEIGGEAAFALVMDVAATNDELEDIAARLLEVPV